MGRFDYKNSHTPRTLYIRFFFFFELRFLRQNFTLNLIVRVNSLLKTRTRRLLLTLYKHLYLQSNYHIKTARCAYKVEVHQLSFKLVYCMSGKLNQLNSPLIKSHFCMNIKSCSVSSSYLCEQHLQLSTENCTCPY